MLSLFVLIVLIVVAALLFWATHRAWRAKSRMLKWAGSVLAGLLAAVASVAGVVMIVGFVKMHTRSAPRPELTVASSSERIQRGEAIADTFCAGCHSPTGTLTGGMDIGKDLPAPIGTFISSNLTPAGALKNWSDGDIFRAIRNGVDADGRWLVIMSYTNAGKLSDDDIKSVIAYIRSLPASGQPTVNPPDHFSPLGVVMLGAGLLPSGKPVFAGMVKAPAKGPTQQFGEYILSYQDCRECHGADLSGGVQGQLAPVGPGLSLVKAWKLGEFISAMRTGVDPGGHHIGKEMPWKPIGRMDDDELQAIYLYLTHLPDAPTPAKS